MSGANDTKEHLGSAFERALRRRDDPAVDRLSYASSTVRFRVTDDDAQSTTLLLDRTPADISFDSEPAEIEFDLTAAQAGRFAAGRLPLTAALMAGEVASRGPVRKYLEVDPILRSLLARATAGTPTSAPERRRASHERPHPELLAIETRDLHKSFGRTTILAGVDLAVPEGMISVVLGPSGTGKSVLLQHVIGLMQPDSGEVLVRGERLGHMTRSQLMAMRPDIGVMFQDGALFSAMNIFDNVAFPLRQHTDLNEEEIEAIVMERLIEVGLGAARNNMPPQLSGGMRKRAGLARALVLDPGIVLCDEPDSGLDPVRTALLGDLLEAEHASSGGTMLVVTHNILLAKQLAEHMSVIWQGRVVESGTTDEVYASENPFVQQFLAGESVGPLSMDA